MKKAEQDKIAEEVKIVEEKDTKKKKAETPKSKTEKKIDAVSKEKVEDIIKKAKENGKITYGELATELEDTNPEQIDKVFDAFEDLGVDILKYDDMDMEHDI